jgi:hypothetical protein
VSESAKVPPKISSLTVLSPIPDTPEDHRSQLDVDAQKFDSSDNTKFPKRRFRETRQEATAKTKISDTMVEFCSGKTEIDTIETNAKFACRRDPKTVSDCS